MTQSNPVQFRITEKELDTISKLRTPLNKKRNSYPDRITPRIDGETWYSFRKALQSMDADRIPLLKGGDILFSSEGRVYKNMKQKCFLGVKGTAQYMYPNGINIKVTTAFALFFDYLGFLSCALSHDVEPGKLLIRGTRKGTDYFKVKFNKDNVQATKMVTVGASSVAVARREKKIQNKETHGDKGGVINSTIINVDEAWVQFQEECDATRDSGLAKYRLVRVDRNDVAPLYFKTIDSIRQFCKSSRQGTYGNFSPYIRQEGRVANDLLYCMQIERIKASDQDYQVIGVARRHTGKSQTDIGDVRTGDYNGNTYTVTSKGFVRTKKGFFDVGDITRTRNGHKCYYSTINTKEVLVRTIVAKIFNIPGAENIHKKAFRVDRKDWSKSNSVDNLVVVNYVNKLQEKWCRHYEGVDPNTWKETTYDWGCFKEDDVIDEDEFLSFNGGLGFRTGLAVERTCIDTKESKIFSSISAAARDLGYGTDGNSNPLFRILKENEGRCGTYMGYDYKVLSSNFELAEGEILYTNKYKGATMTFTNFGRVRCVLDSGGLRFHNGYVAKDGRKRISANTDTGKKMVVLLSRAIASTHPETLGGARQILIKHGIPIADVIEATSCIWTFDAFDEICVKYGLRIIRLQCDHKDCDCSNDHSSNLQWVCALEHAKKSAAERKESGVHKENYMDRTLLKINAFDNCVVNSYSGPLEAERSGNIKAKNIHMYVKNGTIDKNGFRWEFEEPKRYENEIFKLIALPGGRKMWISSLGRAIIYRGMHLSITSGSLDPAGYVNFSSESHNLVKAHRVVASAFLFDSLRDQMIQDIPSKIEASRIRSYRSHIEDLRGKVVMTNDIKRIQELFEFPVIRYEVSHNNFDSSYNAVSNLSWMRRREHRQKDSKRRRQMSNTFTQSKRAKNFA